VHPIRSSPRGAPRDARVAGTPLRGPMISAGGHGSRLSPACAGSAGTTIGWMAGRTNLHVWSAGSVVCGLLFTMKIPTQACEPSASAAVNAQHRHPSLPGLTRQSIVFEKSFCENRWAPGSSPGRREPAESAGCACLLFSSCYVLLFGGHQLRETDARSSPFPVLFRCVTSGGRLYPRSCFSPVIYRSRSGGSVYSLAPRSGERVASAHKRVYARLRRAMGASRVRGK
jgi:hypothetical protein